jgi:hypothetical protein
LLALLKSRLDPAAFAHVQNAIPIPTRCSRATKTKSNGPAGGLLDAVKGMAGKLLGGEQEPPAPDSPPSGSVKTMNAATGWLSRIRKRTSVSIADVTAVVGYPAQAHV